MARTGSSGRSWSITDPSLTGHFYPDIVVDPVDANTAYAIATDDVFKTVDGGATWLPAHQGFATPGGYSLAIDPTDPQTLYAGTFSEIYKSTDGAATWTALSGAPNIIVEAITIDPTDPLRVYAAGYSGVYRSVDGGVSWSRIGASFDEDVFALVIDPTDPTVLFAGTDTLGAYESTDGGRHWSQVNAGLPTYTSVNSLAFDPVDPGSLYAGTTAADLSGGGVYAFDGSAWSTLGTRLPDSWVYAIAVDPTGTWIHAATAAAAVWDLRLR
jgi:photosystem II stability/assembly factor-like uncharacterized protein